MTREQDNEMWKRIESASRPTPEELRETEAELQLIDSEPLTQEQTEQLLARAGVRTTLEPKQQRRALLGLAAAALLAIAGVAMVGADVYPTSPSPMLSLQWQDAIDDMQSPETPENDWGHAIGFVNGYCRDALDIIYDLQTDANADVAAAAADAHSRLADGITPSATRSDMDLLAALEAAADASISTDARIAGVDRVEELIAIGVAAMRSATEDTPRKLLVKPAYLNRIDSLLQR